MLYQAEVMTCIQALKIVNEVGMGRVIIKIDAQNLKLTLTAHEMDNRISAILLREARFLALINFDAFQVLYCPRV